MLETEAKVLIIVMIFTMMITLALISKMIVIVIIIIIPDDHQVNCYQLCSSEIRLGWEDYDDHNNIIPLTLSYNDDH